MIRRRLRRSGSNVNMFYSIRDFSKAENQRMVMWLFRLCDSTLEMANNKEYLSLYQDLVEVLDLKAHSCKVIKALIDQAIHNKKLTPKKDAAPNMHPYNMIGDIDRVFEEDPSIYSNCGEWPTDTQEEIDLVRVMFSGDGDTFERIIAYTFFCKKCRKNESFNIPDWKRGEYEIPKSFIALDKDYSHTKLMKDSFGLTNEEACFLNTVYLCHTIRELYPLLNNLHHQDRDRLDLYSQVMEYSFKEIKALLRHDRKLISFGLVDNEGSIEQDVLDCIYAEDINMYFCDVLKEDSKKETYKLDSFSVKPEESELAQRLLQNSGSANILFYGNAGAGKTEYARALAHASGLKTYIFKNELEVDEKKGGTSDKALSRLNCLLSLNKEDSVIIVDEAESVLSTGVSLFSLLFGGDGSASSAKKGTVNTMLENSQNKVIWILNYTNPLDESTLRRFNYSIRFSEMTSNMLKTIADTKLKKLKLNESLHKKLVDLCGKYRVTGASVDNIVKTVKGMKISELGEDRVISDVKKVLEANSTLLYGKPKMREKVKESYDLSILNTSVPADEIVEMVQNACDFAEENKLEGSDAGIRILFYGMSGTGKTELARYIAEKLGKKILLKRASDILGMYVGQSEKNIRDAFAQAEASGDILLFDEADSFFADRNGASRSWERTQVNEFLTQMEEFSGILICTTNLRTIMDQAMIRRFHIMSEFKALNESGIKKLLNRFFRKYQFTEEMVEQLVSYDSVTPGDFGSLAGKIRFKKGDEVNAQMIVDDLCAIQEEKEMNHKIGFSD